ncbi:TetR/AcrR family transcriptional regulator [Daejeonella oryzae]|uniref:TetR/AcrR family transcriptional regulator n=1 Tax=Daejeonella oryzae TaxID=1122943 RepID=UPI00040D6A97|nr:TetR/AcrR family transcriptional regulator [Daejeonella oryzae]
MDFQVIFKVNEKIYLRDPESSELGKHIIKSAIDLIYELGFEHFTFKKLALEIKTTEATIYRYFENKHRLLLYILNWYWSYLAYLVMFQLQNVSDTKAKLKTIVHLLTHELPDSGGRLDYNKNYLNKIVIAESSKVYLVKEVREINKNEVFKPYKDLCANIADVITAYNPDYQYPKSLSSTLIETAHHQQFFSNFLPRLTDVGTVENKEFTALFMDDMLFKILDKS